MRSDLEGDLRRALASAPAPDTARRDALEDELVARLPVARARRRWPRIALGIGLGGALAAVACALPSDYDADLGHRLAIVVAESTDVDPRAIATFVEERYAPDELRMAVSQHRTREEGPDGSVIEQGGELRIEIDAVGEDIDTDEMWEELVDAFPELEGGRLEDEALRTVVHGTLGGRLSHAWLDVVIDRGSIEDAKAQILLQLDAQGFDGQAHVEIVDDEDPDGHHRREVRVWVEQDSHEPPP
jgi:hypothetical protein